jgi:hypothetical protein
MDDDRRRLVGPEQAQARHAVSAFDRSGGIARRRVMACRRSAGYSRPYR